MHIVTYQSKFHDFKKAMNSTNGLAVMSFFIEVSRSLTISISSKRYNVQFGSIYKKKIQILPDEFNVIWLTEF